jgi:small-conductance mechanosensitive channel
MPDMNSTLLGAELRTWILGGAIVLLVAIAHVAMSWWAKRHERRSREAPPEAGDSVGVRHWIARGLRNAVPPLAFLLWLYGVHLASTTLLAEFPDSRWTARGLTTFDWLRGFGTLLGLAWLLHRIARTADALLKVIASRTEATWDDVLMPFAGRALRLVLPMIALILGAPALRVSPDLKQLIQNAVSMLLVGTIAVVLVQFINAMSQLVLQHYRIDVADNRRARGVYTQVTVLRKIATSVIVLFAIAAMLMVFQPVRQLGTAMLASAGLAGIVIGFAAQKSLGTLLAGLQIALTQPLRIDDVVIVEGEWGRIEEITLTYVVVKIWDLRRLVIPINYFVEKPFQNWTRTSADILGTVFLHVDYTVPVDAVRQELTRILEGSKLWDRKVNVLQVTDVKDTTLELRALASAADAGKAWDLRCEVREKLVTFLQKNYPESLPRVRAVLDKAA